MLYLILIWLLFTGHEQWISENLLYLNAGLAALVLAYLIGAVWRRPETLRNLPHLPAWLFLLLAVTVSSTAMPLQPFAVNQNGHYLVDRKFLTPLTWIFYFILAGAIYYRYGQDAARTRGARRQLIAVGGTIYLVGIIAAFFGERPEHIFAGNITYVMFSFVFLLPQGLEIGHRGLRGAYLLIGAVNVLYYAPRNRTGAVAIVLSGAIMGILYLYRQLGSRKILYAGGAVIVLLCLIAAPVVIQHRPHTVIARYEWQRDALKIWTATPRHFLIGIGSGATWIPSKYVKDAATAEGGTLFTHNFYITVLLENGLLGCTALFFFIYDLYKTRRARSAGANWSLLTLAIFNLLNEPLWFWQNGLLLGVILYARKPVLRIMDDTFSPLLQSRPTENLGTLRAGRLAAGGARFRIPQVRLEE